MAELATGQALFRNAIHWHGFLFLSLIHLFQRVIVILINCIGFKSAWGPCHPNMWSWWSPMQNMITKYRYLFCHQPKTLPILSSSFHRLNIWILWRGAMVIYFLLISWICSKYGLIETSIRISTVFFRGHCGCTHRIVYQQPNVFNMKLSSIWIRNDNRNVWNVNNSLDRKIRSQRKRCCIENDRTWFL